VAIAGVMASTSSAASRDLLDAANIRIDGATNTERMGWSVDGAGDINDDGLDDLLLGAWASSRSGRSESGATYVVYGSASHVDIDLANLQPGQGFRIDGAGANDRNGFAVAGAGDVNGDGVDDLLTSSWYASPRGRSGAGLVYVVFGGGSISNIDLANLPANRGFRIDGANADDLIGFDVDRAGDVNGDGKGDIVIGAFSVDAEGRTDAGAAYVVYGSADPGNVDLATLTSAQGIKISGAAENDQAGYRVAGIGDFNGDGKDDVLVSASLADNNERNDSGSAYVLYGSATLSDIDLAALDAGQGFRIDGAASNDNLGVSADSAGDVNGDGRQDLIIGALEADNNLRGRSGSAYVVYGAPASGNLDLAGLDSSRGFRIDGAAGDDQAGRSVAGAGDVDRDGYDDILVGASGTSNNGRDLSGSTYLLYGSPAPAYLDLADLTSDRGIRFDGGTEYEQNGFTSAGVGDIDGDHLDDVLSATPWANYNGRSASGSAYLITGSSLPNLPVTKSGNGQGSITSSPAGIDCGDDCSGHFDDDAEITLTATPATGSDFTGWSGGGCSGTTATCTVTMDRARGVTASFVLETHQLTVTKPGNGVGSVGSAPAGIDCGSDCSEGFNYGTEVTLTATAATGSDFTGWSGGGCSGNASTCTVTMDQARSVSASFVSQKRTLSVTRAGTGPGSVTSAPAGIDCGNDCAGDFDYGTEVTLTAVAPNGSHFAGWSGDGCSGASSSCTVTMDQARAVTAEFSLETRSLAVNKAGNGSGSVTSAPAGIDCGSDCSESFDYGKSVTLVAAAAAGSEFTGWSGGGCAGTASTCTVTMDQARTVTATFVDTPPETAITKAPPRKTFKPKVTFAFGSSKPGSTFECSLDDKAFRACESPLKLRVKPGAHVLAVRAVDPAGTADASPAEAKFKVKKRKKK
jgi:hypothetical protein